MVGGATRCGIICKFAYKYHSCHIFIVYCGGVAGVVIEVTVWLVNIKK